MTAPHLVLHQHPFASFCQKAVIALYELDLPFETALIDGPEAHAEMVALWPTGKMPVLRDDGVDATVGESTTVIEYADGIAAGGPRLVPADPGAALTVRMWDRFFDHYVQVPMQKVVADALRPEGSEDPFGVAEARETLDASYVTLDDRLAGIPWAAGDAFSMADCAAAPALFYARIVHPWDEAARPHLTRYYRDLVHRPSVLRSIDDARPFRGVFPLPWPDDADAHQPAR
ncbi:glutathione S-transferase family protein [Patulibacter minatonensis]|uniref:glutathione S-transferase family protein n=1 Tax=Patulibacter minatonensis TaxID=298163 RepID=UPI00047DA7F3|nr:glutathione S-transferase family protein [Patulibacter minatonensis]